MSEGGWWMVYACDFSRPQVHSNAVKHRFTGMNLLPPLNSFVIKKTSAVRLNWRKFAHLFVPTRSLTYWFVECVRAVIHSIQNQMRFDHMLCTYHFVDAQRQQHFGPTHFHSHSSTHTHNQSKWKICHVRWIFPLLWTFIYSVRVYAIRILSTYAATRFVHLLFDADKIFARWIY